MHLDLSSNDLSNIEHDAFAVLNELRTLDLSHNKLDDLTLKLTDVLEHCSIASNNLQYWPIATHLQSLKTLDLQHNRLIELFNAALGKGDIGFSNVTKINVSHNHLETLPSTLRYPELKVFDLSFNRFAEMPQTLGQQAPNLDWLRMSGNPLHKIEFTQKMFARKMEFNELPSLSEFDAGQFDWICKRLLEYVWLRNI